MSKKLIYLVSFALVFGLALTSVTNAAQSGLVGYWRLEEGTGTAVGDASGNDNHGTLEGGAKWTTGKLDGGVYLDGVDDYIEIPNLISEAGTMGFWFKPDWDGSDPADYRLFDASLGGIYFFISKGANHADINPEDFGFYLEDGTDADYQGIEIDPAGVITADTWFHVTVTWEFGGGPAILYLDGKEVARADTLGPLPALYENPRFGLQTIDYIASANGAKGVIDDIAIFDRALTGGEIQTIMSGLGEYPWAWGPDPDDGTLYSDTWISLSWSAGDFAVSHDVYLGDNFDDVNDGAEGTFQGNQVATNLVVGFPGFAYPDGLVPGTTYYWRIDEVNDTEPNSPWKGPVWSFSIPPMTAYYPDPVNGAELVEPDVELSWTAGLGVKLHHVYFGDSFDDVNNAVVGLPQATTTYTPGTLEIDKVYYWRIDEFDGVVTHKGDVWSFRTLPIIAITDPNLLGWWMLDEGYGTTVLDWSGHGSHGTLEGDPQWVAGYDGDALDLDGAGDNVYAAAINLPTNAFTVALWFNSNSALNDSSPRQDFLYWQTGSRPHLTFNRSGTGEIGLWPNIGEDFDGPLTATRSWAAGTWYHIAGTFDGASFKIYVNGNLENVVNHPGIHGDASGLLIGCRTDQRNYFDGKIDDVRLYDTALTQEAIKLAMRGDTRLAWGPSPANGSTSYIDEVMPVSWSPGDNAAQHDVYFGTDRDAVDNADTSTPDIYRGRQGNTSYTPREGVEWGQSYYWRIDEYNSDETINKGRVWSFVVNDYLTVDDFEDYDTGENQIWYAWKDGLGYGTPGTEPYYPGNGTGSAVGDENTGSYTEETIVHGGGKSMPFFYDNSILKYSEAEKTLSSKRDWTREGVNTLTIWFRGDSANAAETLYVALNGSAVVSHDNPDAAQIATWTQWNIDLQAFADQGVNLANVNSIALGIGNRNNPVAGGSGTMYFDDIRLYQPAQ